MIQRFIALIAFVSVFASSFCSIAWATPEERTKEGLLLRAFLADLITATSQVDPEVQNQHIRSAIAHNPEIVEWVAAERDLEPIAKEGDVESALRTSTDGKGVKPFLDGKLDEVIQDIASSQGGEGIAETLKSHPELRKPMAIAGAKHFKDLNVEGRIELLKKAGDSSIEKIREAVNQNLERARMSESAAVKMLMDPAHAIQIADFPKDKAGLFNELVVKYYDALPLPEKRLIIIEQLKLPPYSSIDKQLSVLLQNSGPAIQKLFQLFGKDAKSPIIRAAMTELFSSVKPFPGAEAMKMGEARLKRPLDEVFSEFIEEPLASATVGQVHRARLRSNGQWVVVKFLRPGIRERGKKDMAVFKSIISDSPFEKALVTNLEESLMLELNFLYEDANIAASSFYIRPEQGLSIAKRVEGLPAFEDLLILEMAPGINMSKPLHGISPELKGQAINNLLERWYDEAIFGSGKFHADLHPGNLFYQPQPGKKPPFLLTVIDFGAYGELTLPQRRGFMALSMAVVSQSPEQTLDALADISEIPFEKRAKLLGELHLLFEKKMTISQRMTEVFITAVDGGLTLPRTLLQFNRGRTFLEKALAEVNKELDVLDPKGRKLRFDPIRTYLTTSAKRVGLSMPETIKGAIKSAIKGRVMGVLGREKPEEPVVTLEMLNKTLTDNRDRMLGYFRCSLRGALQALLAGG